MSMRQEFPIWKTIQIGGKSKDELIAELEAKDMVSDSGWVILDHQEFTPSSDVREIQLTRVSVGDLGCTGAMTGEEAWIRSEDLRIDLGLTEDIEEFGSVSTQEVWRRARELGLLLCPAEVGPYLRLAETDQSNLDQYFIGMEPIDCDGYSVVFELGHSDWLFIGSHDADPGSYWFADDLIVFMLPGK